MDFTVVFYGLLAFVGASFSTICVYIGTISSRCVQQSEYKKDQERLQEQLKTDRHNCKNECHGKLITLEAKMTEQNDKVDRRYNDKTELLFAQNDKILSLLAEISKQIGVIENEISHLKGGTNEKT